MVCVNGGRHYFGTGPSRSEVCVRCGVRKLDTIWRGKVVDVVPVGVSDVASSREYRLLNHRGGVVEAFGGRNRMVVGVDGVLRQKSEVLVYNSGILYWALGLLGLELFILSCTSPSMGGGIIVIAVPVVIAVLYRLFGMRWREVEHRV
jgi:hypothetical protein